jgi:LPXTG-motif cell wall-anchored protein
VWRLLKAEVSYDRLRIGLFLFLCMVAFLTIWLGVKWERNRVPMIMLMVLVLSLAAVYAGEKTRSIQKRDRLHVLFPVSLWEIGMTHLFYPVIVLLIMYFLLFVSVLVVRPLVNYSLTMPSLSHMLTLIGLVLIVNAVILLHRDLRIIFSRKPQRLLIFVFWFVVYIGALLPFYVVTNFLGVFGENTPAQNLLTRLLESSTGFMAAGLLLSAISLVVFVKRKSYVNS